MSVSSQVKYNMKPTSVPGRQFQYICQAAGGAAPIAGSKNSVIQISIPGKRGQYLDTSSSYLRYSIKGFAENSGSAVTCNLEGGPMACFSKFELTHGASLVESCANYNTICAALTDSTVSGETRTGAMSVMGGTDPTTSGTGVSLGSNAVLPANSARKTVCTPMLLSGVLSPNDDSYLPIGFAHSADFVINLTLEDAKNALLGGTGASTGGYELSDVAFVATIVELDAQTDAAIYGAALQAGGGVVRVSGESYRAFSTSLSSTDTAFSQSLPCRFSSLNALFGMFQLQASQNDFTEKSISQRVKPDNLSLNWRVGSSVQPPHRISTGPELFMNLQRCFNSTSIANAHTCHTGDSYNSKSDGTFLCGYELSLWNSQSQVIDSGLDSISNSNLAFEGTMDAIGGSGLLITSVARYSHAMVIDPSGGLQVVF